MSQNLQVALCDKIEKLKKHLTITNIRFIINMVIKYGKADITYRC